MKNILKEREENYISSLARLRTAGYRWKFKLIKDPKQAYL
jgi:hypothetical protein